MKAWILHDVNEISFEDTGIPLPKENEVLLKVKACGICGSDIPRIYETGAHRMPLILGHELSGVIEGIGKNVKPYLINKRAGVYPLIPCRKCKPCMEGHFELCRSYNYLGSRCNGGFAEYVTVPEANLIKLPDEVSYEEAAMLEPMAVAVHAVRKGTDDFKLPRDRAIAVCGLGTIGLMVCAFLKEAGYESIYAIGNKEYQREKIKKLRISGDRYTDNTQKEPVSNEDKHKNEQTDKKVIDPAPTVFFDCVGKNECVKQGIDILSPKGRLVCVGNPYTDMVLPKDTYWKILRNELTVTGTWNSAFNGTDNDDFNYVLKRISEKRINAELFISHRLSLKELNKGLHIMKDKTEDYTKIMVYGNT